MLRRLQIAYSTGLKKSRSVSVVESFDPTVKRPSLLNQNFSENFAHAPTAKGQRFGPFGLTSPLTSRRLTFSKLEKNGSIADGLKIEKIEEVEEDGGV